MRGFVIGAIVGVLVVAACTKTFQAEVVQPNPLANPTETLRTSEELKILTGDMDLKQPDAPDGIGNASMVHSRNYKLINTASFTMVSRDRLRFHVQVDHKWEDFADLKTWEVSLEDDQGHRWTPESVEHARTRLITHMWDPEQRTAICGTSGRDGKGDCFNTVGYQDDGWKRRQMLGSLSVFRGNADFVFYQRDLFTPSLRTLKLVVRRSGTVFEYTWNFDDTVASQ